MYSTYISFFPSPKDIVLVNWSAVSMINLFIFLLSYLKDIAQFILILYNCSSSCLFVYLTMYASFSLNFYFNIWYYFSGLFGSKLFVKD